MNSTLIAPPVRRKAVWGPKRTAALLLALGLGCTSVAYASGRHRKPVPTTKPGVPGKKAQHPKLDRDSTYRAEHLDPNGTTSVVVTLQPGAKLPAEFSKYARKGKLNLINGHVVDVPNRLLKQLAAHPSVFDVHYNRPTFKHNFRTALTIGTRAVQAVYGYTGAGVGVAVLDSGVTAWHDDLTNLTAATYPYGNQRVSAFVDFVNGQLTPYDDNGHGTHVAGIIAGNGADSNGQKAGSAPDASIVSLKVLDANGNGNIGNIIAALDWVVANKDAYNIRVINMSVGASIKESYWTDPLTLAAKRVADAGVVVVAAAGNIGKNAAGEEQYGGITAPGNAPWVLTVGASSSMGTATRDDDTMASFSSRGPSFVDWGAKPDIVAPGAGIVSLADPTSQFYTTKAAFLVPGQASTSYLPYLSLSGTSMAAPVVAGTVALMLQANPSLTPNMVKAILQYTSQNYGAYDPLTEGAGFLNAMGAVRLARFYATAQPGDAFPVQDMWSKHIIWGNHMLAGGVPLPDANAFESGVVWGAAQSTKGDNIVWGSGCASDACDNIVWGNAGLDNIVWGSLSRENIVWGSGAGKDNVVWGSDCGGGDCDVVWGSSDGDNIVWGSCSMKDNIVWGSSADGDNIVWGSSADGDNIVWGSSAKEDNIVWGSSTATDTAWTDAAQTVAAATTAAGPSLDEMSDDQLLQLVIQISTNPPSATTTTPVVGTTSAPSSSTTTVVPDTTSTTSTLPQTTTVPTTIPGGGF
jgi:serine protease AprX